MVEKFVVFSERKNTELERESYECVCFRVSVTGIVYWCVAMNPGVVKRTNGTLTRNVIEGFELRAWVSA